MQLCGPQTYGYYEVAGKHYHNKLQAFEAAFSIGHCPHWNFFEEAFSTVDWTQEPSQSILELYAERARSIRESADHVILWFSGGADSWTIADAFVNNNILIDELWTVAPFGWNDPNNTSTHASNQFNEVFFTSIPEAKKFIQKDPRIKYKVLDSSPILENFWANNTIDPFNINHLAAELPISEFFTGLAPNNKSKSARIVKVYGIDKPRIMYQDGKFYLTFLDQIVHSRMATAGTIHADHHFYDEAFYWHPDSIKILIKQGHLIKQWFKQHPQFLPLLSQTVTHSDTLTYQRIIRDLIYPSYNTTLWQTSKNTGLYDLECYHTLSENSNSKAGLGWRNTIKKYSNSIYDLFVNNNRIDDTTVPIKNYGWYYGLPGCYSKFYCLGS
jgi:hypothetical protein